MLLFHESVRNDMESRVVCFSSPTASVCVPALEQSLQKKQKQGSNYLISVLLCENIFNVSFHLQFETVKHREPVGYNIFVKCKF